MALTASNIILPGEGENIGTWTAPDGKKYQGLLLVRSDTGDPLTADANGLKVSAVIGAGTANIGDVDVQSVPANPFGANADAASASGSISAKLREIATSGIILKTGTAEVGKVEISDGTTQAEVTAAGTHKGLYTAQLDANGDPLGYPPPLYSTLTPTLTTTAYTAGDGMGGAALALADAAQSSGGTGHLLGVTFVDKDDLTHDGTNGQYYVHIFSGNVTPGTDNAAFALANDTEAASYIATIDTSDGTWYDVGPAKVCAVFPPGGPIPYRCVGSTNLYFAIVAKTTASGSASASGLVIVPHCVLD